MEIKEALFRVTDLETTGIDAETCHICEIAYVDTGYMKDLYPTSEAATLVNPGVPIPPEASAVHHITDEEVEWAPKIDQIIEPLIMKDRVFVAHNAAFEQAFIHRAFPVDVPWLCTWRLAMHLIPGLQSYANQYLRYYLKLDVPEAKGLAAHRALADCYVTAALLRHLLSLDHGCTTVEELIQLAGNPVELRTVTFGKHRGTSWDDVPSDYLAWMLRKEWDKDTEHTIHRQLERRR